METLRISALQTDIVWENKEANLRSLRRRLQALEGETDVVVLPEMFSTGFSMRSRYLAEPMDGLTLTTLKRYAREEDVALAGSFIVCDGGKYFNRGFFLTPEGDEWYYDKRHLFRMGGEHEHFCPGCRPSVFAWRGWNISLLVCYDLRFPVWSRNVVASYDLLIYVANWPAARRKNWDVLLRARAIENQCYVCGVNRMGAYNNYIRYNGGSAIYDWQGDPMASVPDDLEGTATASLHLSVLRKWRERFPAWKDADPFLILPDPPPSQV